MIFTVGDIAVIVIYFAISLGVGMLVSRRASGSLVNYFLSGRSAPWWLVGTGMVATTFAADTPLWVAGVVATHGISGNWLWWSAAAGGTLTVFFFARLWRRAGVLTDLEFIELRYGGPNASFLRGFKAIYFGVLMNCVVLGWVNLAMLKIMRVIFPEVEHPELLVVGVAVLTLGYVTVSGLWGVMVADAFQFVVALGGCILLAVFALQHPTIVEAGGLAAALPPGMLDFLPDFSALSSSETSVTGGEAAGGSDAAGGESIGLARIAQTAFFAYLLIQWWASWYPGNEPGGGGYIAQRIMSAKDERNGVLATLWFVVAHYCVRSWPWIVAGLAAVVIYPQIAADKREESFVYLIRDVLPSPLGGLLVAAFLGAYMSTLSTHLNWGSSYVVNDCYRRFLRKERPDQSQEANDKHYVMVSRLTTVVLAVVSLAISFTVLTSIADAWNFLLSITGGMGFILILRWYWWRVNAAAELASMVAPLAVIIAFAVIPYFWPEIQIPGAPENLYVIVPVSILITLAIMYATQPESAERLRIFYDRVRPVGPGWRSVSGESRSGLGRLFLGWLAATALVYSMLFGVGSVIFARYEQAAILAAIALLSVAVVHFVLRREFRDEA
ncbi:MAG: Na+:solute symporter [bacterium]|nr:Na+:solute symporter [bacterium]